MGEPAQIVALPRLCRRCHATKPAIEFVHDRGSYTRLCRECSRSSSREAYAAHREERKAAAKAYRAKNKDRVTVGDHDKYWERKKRDPIGYVLIRVKSAARAAGVPFDLTREDIFVPEFCPVLGIKLRPLGSGNDEDAAQVDRLIPSRGYVRGNVAVISGRANRLKDNATADELERIAAWMRSRGV